MTKGRGDYRRVSCHTSFSVAESRGRRRDVTLTPASASSGGGLAGAKAPGRWPERGFKA